MGSFAAHLILIDQANQCIAQYERERLEDGAELYEHREMPADLKEKVDAQPQIRSNRAGAVEV